MSPDHRGPETDAWHLLCSTNRGLEEIAIDEIESRLAVDATVYYPGMVRCTASEAAVYELNACSRSIHRVLVELARVENIDAENPLAGIYDLVREIDLRRFLGPEQSFAVRTKRRGEHDFTSMDVEREVGQAIIDEYRATERRRPPVDLDDPTVIFRVFVRGNTVIVTVDTTGQHSLHRRRYREHEHHAPLRPTMAYAMCQYAGYEPGDRLLDPMCGCGTIPIEAAQAARDRPLDLQHDVALSELRFLDAREYGKRQERRDSPDIQLDVLGSDIDTEAIAGARENAAAVGLDGTVPFETADATQRELDADCIVTDLPFGIRTEGNLRTLYEGFFDRVADSEWRRLVVHTARTDLVPFEPVREIEMRRGRLETSILVVE